MWVTVCLSLLLLALARYGVRLATSPANTLILDLYALPAVFDHIAFLITSIPLGLDLAYVSVFGRRGVPALTSSSVPYIPLSAPPTPKNARNTMDVYTPPPSTRPRGLIVFVYGGAWSSGSKTTYAPIGYEFVRQGYAAMVGDYTLVPDAQCKQMVEEVRMLIGLGLAAATPEGRASQWDVRPGMSASLIEQVCAGARQGVHVVGHSAGGHLSVLGVLEQAVSELQGMTGMGESNSLLSWAPRDLGSLVSIAGVYDVGDHYRYEQSRSVAHLSGLFPAMEAKEAALPLYSPTQILPRWRDWRDAIAHRLGGHLSHLGLLPHLHILHPEGDTTVPFSSATKFARSLSALSVPHTLTPLPPPVSHSSAILSCFHPSHSLYRLVFIDHILPALSPSSSSSSPSSSSSR